MYFFLSDQGEWSTKVMLIKFLIMIVGTLTYYYKHKNCKKFNICTLKCATLSIHCPLTPEKSIEYDFIIKCTSFGTFTKRIVTLTWYFLNSHHLYVIHTFKNQ